MIAARKEGTSKGGEKECANEETSCEDDGPGCG
jgi:hypothetical protein